MMKILMRKPLARTAKGNVIHHEIERLRYIRYHSNTYGTMLSIICQSARQVEGF